MGKMKAKIYEDKIKIDVIEFTTLEELNRKIKKKWG
jgi:hypothetical protein